MQEVHLGNPIFQSEMKGSSVIVTLHSPIHENFDTIDSNVTIIIQDYKERNKILESNLNYNPINDKMDIMNKQREIMNVKVIDESIKEIDQSHQKVDNIRGQGAKILLFLNTTHKLTVTGISKIPNPTTLHSSISSIQETKENQA